MQPPGSKLLLDLPRTFVPADRFVGFVDPQRGISIISSDLPRDAYASVAGGMTPEALTAKGMERARPELLARADEHVYLRAQQLGPGGEIYEKYLLVFKSEAATTTVSINVPQAAFIKKQIAAADIDAILASARMATGEAAPLKPAATIDEPAPLKPALRFGLTQMWTLDGRSGDAGASSPSVIVSGSTSTEAVPDAVDLAKRGLTTLAGFKDVEVTRTTKTTSNRLPAVEALATAVDAKTGEPRVIYQLLVVPKGGGFVRLVGIAPAAEADRWLLVFRKASGSLKLAK